MVGELIHEPLIKTSDFDPVRGRILLLQPENDIFSKKDQKTLEELLPEPEVHYMRGSHHGPWVLQEDYILMIRDLLNEISTDSSLAYLITIALYSLNDSFSIVAKYNR